MVVCLSYAQEFIASQQVTKGVDIMFGGGRDYYLPKSEGGLREDGKNLLDEAAKAGVSVATTLNQFNAISKMPTLGLFGMSHVRFPCTSLPFSPPLTTPLPFSWTTPSTEISNSPPWLKWSPRL